MERDAPQHREWRLFPIAMVLLGVATVLIVLSAVLFPMSGTGYSYGGRMMGGATFWWMALLPLLFLLFFVLLLAALVGGRPHPSSWMHAHVPYPAISAQELLNHRYANGEITREQYLKMKEDLAGSGSLHA